VGDDPEPTTYMAGRHENVDRDIVWGRGDDPPDERRRLMAEHGRGTDG
jgi:hypothetical protein